MGPASCPVKVHSSLHKKLGTPLGPLGGGKRDPGRESPEFWQLRNPFWEEILQPGILLTRTRKPRESLPLWLSCWPRLVHIVAWPPCPCSWSQTLGRQTAGIRENMALWSVGGCTQANTTHTHARAHTQPSSDPPSSSDQKATKEKKKPYGKPAARFGE